MELKKLSMQELQRISGDDFRGSSKLELTLVLDSVRSMMNVGSVFRTADAFRVKKICLCGITATPPHREIQKTALGATESVAWEYHVDCPGLLAGLREQGAIIVAVEQLQGSTSLDDWKPDPAAPLVLVFGNEVNGVSDEALAWCHYGLEIPQHGTKHSLNIAVSAGIVIWEAYRHLRSQLGI